MNRRSFVRAGMGTGIAAVVSPITLFSDFNATLAAQTPAGPTAWTESVPPSNYVPIRATFWDDMSRASGPIDGRTSESGQIWTEFHTTNMGEVVDGRLQMEPPSTPQPWAAYPGVTLDETPTHVGAVVAFDGTTFVAGATAVGILIGNDANGFNAGVGFPKNMVHIIFSPTYLSVNYYDNEVPSDALMLFEWDTTPTSDPFRVDVELNGPHLIVRGPNGFVASTVHPKLEEVAGPIVIWEPYYGSTYPADSDAIPQILSVYAGTPTRWMYAPEQATTNRCTNPSAEVNATDGVAVQQGASVSRVTTEHFVGAAAFECDFPGTQVFEAVTWYSLDVTGLAAGDIIGGQCQIQGPGTFDLQTKLLYNGYALGADTIHRVVLPDAEWYWIAVPLRVPAHTSLDQLQFVASNWLTSATIGATSDCRIDAVQIEKGYPSMYGEGVRSAQSAVIGPASILDSRSGALAFEFERRHPLGTEELVLEAGVDGDDWLRILIETDGTASMYWSSGGALPQVVTSAIVLETGTTYRAFAEWKHTAMAFWIDDESKAAGMRDVPIGMDLSMTVT